MDLGSLSCGPYQLKDVYWTDCGKPGSGKSLRITIHATACLSETSYHDLLLITTIEMYLVDVSASVGSLHQEQNSGTISSFSVRQVAQQAVPY